MMGSSVRAEYELGRLLERPDLRRAATLALALGMPKVVSLLQVQPEPWGCAGQGGELDGILSCHAPLAVNQLVQPHKRPTETVSSRGLRNRRIVGLQKLFEQDLPWMDRLCGLHRGYSFAAAIANSCQL